MGYLYKLVDNNGLENAKKNLISFSRPMFEFKGSEGKILKFSNRIYAKYSKKKLEVKPSKTDLKEIKKWIDTFKKTYGEELSDYDMDSESRIMFCLYMQTYCAYFTRENLFDDKIRNDFIEKFGLTDKVAVITINEDVLNHLHWHSTELCGSFTKFYGDSDCMSGFNGFLHLHAIEYTENYDDCKFLLERYNTKVRRISSWFNLLSKTYEYQKEIRLIFTLNSFEPNSSTLAFEKVYHDYDDDSIEFKIYKNLIAAFYYKDKLSPSFINLKLDSKDIEILMLENNK